MAEKRKPARVADPKTPLEVMLNEHLDWLEVRNFSEITVRVRRKQLGTFLKWSAERGITEPMEVTRPILESYQRHLFYSRKKDGEPLSFRTQHLLLSHVRSWFRWMTRKNYILHNPASELELPRIGHYLPKHVLTLAEIEQVLQQPDIRDAIGLRDRAMLETLYSTGMRRMELVNLKLYDLDADGGTLLIRQGKGKKDRVVPIGERAVAWIQKYKREVRPQLASEPDELTVFLTINGEALAREHLSDIVRYYVDQAELGKRGSAHLIRHTTATLMLENGADIRFIQQLLGHERLTTTEKYTHVSIRMLKHVHSETHPAARLDLDKPDANAQDEQLKADLLTTLQAEADEDREDE
jgi:integrase/recombinase XerD